MPPFKFVHTADLHLDSPFKGLSALNAEISAILKDATFRTFENIISLCIDKKVDFLLIAGDVYDSEDKSLRAQLRFRDGLKRLSNHGIAAYIVHGNHDPLDQWCAELDWPQNVHIFGDSVTSQLVTRGDKTIARVYGISYGTKEIRENLAVKFHREPDNSFAIGLLHCNCGSNTGHEPYAPCLLDDLIRAGMDYWALGHVHKREILSESKPTVVYAGNPVGRNPKELGPRGCYLVNVDAKGRVIPEFVAVDAIRWFSESLSIDEIQTPDDLINQLESTCEQIREQAENRHTLCRLSLAGRSEIHYFLAREGTISDLEVELRGKFVRQNPFFWLDKIENETLPPIDIKEVRKRSDFLGELSRLSDECRKDDKILECVFKKETDILYNSSVGRKFLPVPTLSDIKTWIEEAEYRCLDLLRPEEEE